MVGEGARETRIESGDGAAGKLPISTMSLKWINLSFGFDKGPRKTRENGGKNFKQRRKTSS